MPATDPAAFDAPLLALVGSEVPSEVVPGVRYRIVWRLGQGGMSVVFFALRITPDGESPVVMKLLRPSFVTEAGPLAALSVKKEAIALGRLNEVVPPTPFVVRFIDTGVVPVDYGGAPVVVPWVVVEYVHGGAEGTTLSERVDKSIEATGAAFDPVRAANAVDCLTAGLVAVHEVGVIHRDLKPDNVLCCGFGNGEILKLADFGVARPEGVATFTDAVVGTPGFVAPELALGDSRAIGPRTDIFSLGAVIYFLLTGEEYFTARSAGEALVAAMSPKRKSLLDAKALSPEFRADERACRAIDAALVSATSAKLENRPARALDFAAMLLPWLQAPPSRASVVERRLVHLCEETVDEDQSKGVARFRWSTMRCPANLGLGVVRSVAWDGDGRSLVATTKGLAFWNGSSFSPVSGAVLREGAAARFVQRKGAGQWLIGCNDGTFVTIATFGVVERRTLEGSPRLRFERISGDLDDLAVLVGRSSDGYPVLCGRIAGRWLKPLPLREAAAVASVARVEDARFFIAGRGADESAFLGIYSPLDWEAERLDVPKVRAYLACSGQVERGVGMAVGADGAVVLRRGSEVTFEVVDASYDLSAAAIDVLGRAWAASGGRIWLRRPNVAPTSSASAATWEPVWDDPAWATPIVSIFADPGGVVAMTADGGVIEGRAITPTLAD
jgi:serine/threonine protein kinase